MSKARRHQAVGSQGLVASKQPRRLPPAESELWPEYCRGKLWDWETARFFVGRCQLCAYSCPPPATRRRLDKLASLPTFLLCTNHPDSGGGLREVMPTGMCRNFKMKCWRRPRARPAQSQAATTADGSDPTVRRIPVGQGLFATVDAADYRKLSKYKWYAYRRGRRIYAVCRTGGKTVYMHRMILRPRKGYLVDHFDGNGLNNRRCNLRICTAAQNRANSRPCGGVSGFVGVYPKGNKWRAGITCRGVYYYLGLFDDPVEAAKARDRKAYELHGPYAYLNFPQDFRRPGGTGETCFALRLPVRYQRVRLNRNSTVEGVRRCHPANGGLHAERIPALAWTCSVDEARHAYASVSMAPVSVLRGDLPRAGWHRQTRLTVLIRRARTVRGPTGKRVCPCHPGLYVPR